MECSGVPCDAGVFISPFSSLPEFGEQQCLAACKVVRSTDTSVTGPSLRTFGKGEERRPSRMELQRKAKLWHGVGTASACLFAECSFPSWMRQNHTTTTPGQTGTTGTTLKQNYCVTLALTHLMTLSLSRSSRTVSLQKDSSSS